MTQMARTGPRAPPSEMVARAQSFPRKGGILGKWGEAQSWQTVGVRGCPHLDVPGFWGAPHNHLSGHRGWPELSSWDRVSCLLVRAVEGPRHPVLPPSLPVTACLQSMAQLGIQHSHFNS